MLRIDARGDLPRTTAFLKKLSRMDIYKSLSAYAQQGVTALANATPKDSGLAATSWSYDIVQSSSGITITWKNANLENGFPVAIMLQYGHGTKGGGYVQGRDYINPTMRPVFDRIAEGVWKAVKSA